MHVKQTSHVLRASVVWAGAVHRTFSPHGPEQRQGSTLNLAKQPPSRQKLQLQQIQYACRHKKDLIHGHDLFRRPISRPAGRIPTTCMAATVCRSPGINIRLRGNQVNWDSFWRQAKEVSRLAPAYIYEDKVKLMFSPDQMMSWAWLSVLREIWGVITWPVIHHMACVRTSQAVNKTKHYWSIVQISLSWSDSCMRYQWKGASVMSILSAI